MLNPSKLLTELTHNKHFTVKKKQTFYSDAAVRYSQILFSSPPDTHHWESKGKSSDQAPGLLTHVV